MYKILMVFFFKLAQNHRCIGKKAYQHFKTSTASKSFKKIDMQIF